MSPFFCLISRHVKPTLLVERERKKKVFIITLIYLSLLLLTNYIISISHAFIGCSNMSGQNLR